MHRTLVTIALLAVVAGCDTTPPLAQVSGVVLLDGKPLDEVVVEFLPDPDHDTHGQRSTATTDPQGHFMLTCDDGRPGAVIGTHRVLVQDPRAFPPPRPRPGESARPVSPARVGQQYTKATDTPLRQEVRGGEQSVTIELTVQR